MSSKTKDSTTNVLPVKSAPTLENVPITSTVTALSKPSTRSELAEQRQHQQDLSRSTDSINDQQWHMVSSNKGLRKATTTNTVLNKKETTDESQTAAKTTKPTSTNSGKTRVHRIVNTFIHVLMLKFNQLTLCLSVLFASCLLCFVKGFFPIENPVMVSSSSHAPTSMSNSMIQSRRRRGRRPTRPLSPSHVPTSETRPSFPSMTNRELAFRQLAEQLWAAGLPSSQTACSMSVRSRCSSAPPSERGGMNNEYDDADDENMIEWDAPGKPDDGNSCRKTNSKHAYTHLVDYIKYSHMHDASMISCFLITHA